MDQLSIVVASCDKFMDTWQPFIICFRKYFPDCPYPVVLVTENSGKGEKVRGYDKVIECGNLEWSGRLIKALNEIESSHIFLLLDDFWMTENINLPAFTEDVHKILSNPNIGAIYLNYVKWRFLSEYDDNYLIWPKNAIYRINTRPAIWKKDFLIKTMQPEETVWQFERECPERSAEKKEIVLCRKWQYFAFIYAVTAGNYERNAVRLSEKEGFELSDKRGRRTRIDDLKLLLKGKIFNICPEFFTRLVRILEKPKNGR